ncbi:MAG: GDSL-type esterase/lipase family protein [Acidobacteriota bacterium]
MEKKVSSFIKLSLFVFLLCFVFVNLSDAREDTLLIQGKEAQPFFDRSGNLNIIYLSSEGDINLLTRGKEETRFAQIKPVFNERSIHTLSTQKDRIGNRWLLWEERGRKQSDLYLARLENNTVLDPICLTSDEDGFNFSPALNFSPSNDLWIAWVNYYGGENRLMIKNVSLKQKWLINSYSGLDPQLLFDSLGTLWLFWTAPFRHQDEILFTTYQSGVWTEISTLNRLPNVPHISPTAVIDHFNFLHVVWSAYDGEDYELYYSYWDGIQWSPEEKVTNNRNASDSFPFMTLFYGEIPAVAWVKSSDRTQKICLTYKRGDEWHQEIEIPGSENVTSPPQVVSFQEKTWVFWQSGDQIKASLINNYRLKEWFVTQADRPRPRADTQALDNNKHIAFGDSITYGIINLQPAPDKGYVPRLESLLKNNVNPNATVLNRGKGWEYTAGGLSRINSVINTDQAKTIFIMEGTNDAKDTTVSISTAAYNLEQMANRCLNLNMKVFLGTIIPRMGWQGIIEERIRALNRKITAIASGPSIHLADIFNAFLDYPPGWIYLFSDTTHPNETGYQIMAQTWYGAYVKTLPPTIKTNKDSLYFQGEITDTEMPPKEFEIRNAGGGELVYDISTNKDWLSVSPSSGKSTGEWDTIEVTVDIADLSYGLHEGEITISSDNATNSPRKVDVDVFIKLPPLYPPVNFQGTKEENRSLSLVEYVNALTWEANDQNEDILEKYRIYLVEDEETSLLVEVSAGTFEYWHRNVEKDKLYKYAIAALDIYGRESEFVYTEIQ